jgi:hypothetical protein
MLGYTGKKAVNACGGSKKKHIQTNRTSQGVWANGKNESGHIGT